MKIACLKQNFLNKIHVTFIAKTDLSNPLERKQNWRHILQISTAHGLYLFLFNVLVFHRIDFQPIYGQNCR